MIAPRAVPSTMAAVACQKLRPKKRTAITPMKTVANSMLGEAQVHANWSGPPWRSVSGTGSEPVTSTAMTLSP